MGVIGANVNDDVENDRYEYFFLVDEPEIVLLIDRCKNQKALDIHCHFQMMREIVLLREKYHLHMHVEQFVECEP